jgi:hypothetical protein
MINFTFGQITLCSQSAKTGQIGDNPLRFSGLFDALLIIAGFRRLLGLFLGFRGRTNILKLPKSKPFVP